MVEYEGSYAIREVEAPSLLAKARNNTDGVKETGRGILARLFSCDTCGHIELVRER